MVFKMPPTKGTAVKGSKAVKGTPSSPKTGARVSKAGSSASKKVITRAGKEKAVVKRAHRRDDIDAADRVIMKKLAHIEKDVLTIARGKKLRLPIRDFIVEEGFRKLGASQKYLASEFWGRFHHEYDVRASKFESMVMPLENLTCSDALLEVLLPRGQIIFPHRRSNR